MNEEEMKYGGRMNEEERKYGGRRKLSMEGG